MSYDPFAQPRGTIDPLISVGRSKILKSYIDGNSKLKDFKRVFNKCSMCPFILELDEDVMCKYCKVIFGGN